MAFAQFNQPVTGTRPQGGAYIGGIWVAAPAVPVTSRTSVQAPRDSDLQLLPEGRRADRSYVLYSKQPILEADVYSIYGEPYEVLHVAVWQNRVIPHYKAIAVKMNEMESD